MMNKIKFIFTALTVTTTLSATCSSKISPIEFGLLTVSSPAERYNILLKTHLYAIENNKEIDYTGIDSLLISIPYNAKAIPLPNKCDFKGLKLFVVNNEKNIFIFEKKNQLIPISLNKNDFLTGNFGRIPELRNGNSLLTIKDKTPWVNERRGYDYTFYREDILVIRNGIADNSTIMSYSNTVSDPTFAYCKIDNRKTEVSNIQLIRLSESTYKTYLINIENSCNISLSNIKIFTPESNMYGDMAISFRNCANVSCKDIEIENTYSQIRKYGYGFSLNNVYNSVFKNVRTKSLWGIFGNNNINTAKIIDCDINRFDIHCYGKDITCSNTIFRNLYNQFSSITGFVRFDKCKFYNFVPVLIEDSYSAYTTFNIFFCKCLIEVGKSKPYLIDMRKPTIDKNARKELSDIFWPNLYIKDIQINIPEHQSIYFLYRFSEKNIKYSTPPEVYVNLKGIKLSNDSTKIQLCNIDVHPINILLNISPKERLY